MIQGGIDNEALLEAWRKKLPGVEPTDRELTAFALGVEVGFAHARKLELQDWDRIHHVLRKHGVHPGRTDDTLDDVIDWVLTEARADHEPASLPAWWKCPTHGPASLTAWGCPECVREMREHLTRQNNTA